MAKLGNQVKLAWLKSMEAIGKGASSLASNAHLKVTEINLETRRRELLGEFPLRAHDLWQKGVALPDPLGDMMAELNELDEKLSVLRAQRYARVEVAEGDSGDATAEGDTTAADEDTTASVAAALTDDAASAGEALEVSEATAADTEDKCIAACDTDAENADAPTDDSKCNAAENAENAANVSEPPASSVSDGGNTACPDAAPESEQAGDNA